MIPIQLQLKNFLSYGSDLQTIDFSSYNLICLSGKNGHGKSALLDAITWAIWGYARKTVGAAKADQGLLRLGQTNMIVCLDFYCNSIHYRIRRELTIRHNKPIAALDYGIIQKDGSIISLTDKTIRDTQNKIEKTIKLDFESFCNSAFLRQGQSNEFCKKSPKDRKDVLTKILGLQHYEIIRRLAMDKSKKAFLEKQQLTLLKETIESEIAIEDELQKQNNELLQSMTAIDQTIAIIQNEYNTKKKFNDILLQQKNQYAIDLFALEQAHKQIAFLQNSLMHIRTEWRNTQRQYKNLKNKQDLIHQFDLATKECEELQAVLQKGLHFKEQFLHKKNELHVFESQWRTTFYQQLQKDKNQHNEVLIELKKNEITSMHLANKQKELQTHADHLNKEQIKSISLIQEIDQLKPYFTQIKQQFDKRKAAYQQYIVTGNLYSAQLKELKQKQLLACKTEVASCPLCEQTVTASRRRFLDNKFTKQEQHIAHTINRLTHLVSKLKAIIVEQHTQIEPLQKKIQAQSTIEAMQKELVIKHTITEQELSSINEQLIEIQQKIAADQINLKNYQEQILHREKSEITELYKHIQHKEITAAIQQYEKEAQNLGYNAAVHAEKKSQKEFLQALIEQQKKIEDQILLQNERKKQIEHICHQLRTLKKEQTQLQKQTEHVKEIEQKIDTFQKEQSVIESKLKEIQITKDQLMHNKGSIASQFKKIDIYKEKYKKIIIDITLKTNLQQDYIAIAQATSKDGIQALLIEEVIPEIEYEANELLSRLTNNQAQIIIESVKDLKSGGTKETLDIFISDALGLRPYELFSGGEAFRVDFALRIAISKLVARRSGTALQTLIIDEGFGSQDEEGLVLMMEALHKIQDDFEKIIIVSHLPFMKDHFPVHFNIEKGPLGSNISVIEQG